MAKISMMLAAAAAISAASFVAHAIDASAADCKNHPLLSPDACCNATAPDAFNVTFETTVGGGKSFTIAITKKYSPWGVDRFYNLAKCGGGFLTNGTGDLADNAGGFFRVVTGFVVQFGISGNPTVSNAWANEVIPNDPVIISNTRGTISYAAIQDPNTGMATNRTTQVYINYADNSNLDAMGFTPFGTVVGDGMKVVDAIYAGYAQDPDQDSIYAQGDAYLQANYPKLDYITATTVSE